MRVGVHDVRTLATTDDEVKETIELLLDLVEKMEPDRFNRAA